MKDHRVVALVIGVAVLASCTGSKSHSMQLDPRVKIEALPPADPLKVASVHSMKDWKNPYLIVRVDGVALLDVANHEQHILTPDQLVGALADLPSSAWPYGRVVAVAEGAAEGDSEEHRAQLRKNRALVAGTLQGAQVVINWVPSA